MPRVNSPAVELPDVRSWEEKTDHEQVFYHYTVAARSGQSLAVARVALVWVPAKGVQFVLDSDGETLGRGSVAQITGAWIRAAARISGRHNPASIRERIKKAVWDLDAALPVIRGGAG